MTVGARASPSTGVRGERGLDRSDLILYGSLVAVHVSMGLFRHGPFVFADEIGYLGAARMLAGGTPVEMIEATFYHVGYSILLAPAFLLGSPLLAYKAVMVINAFVLSSVFLVLVAFLRRVEDLGVARARAVALATALYPPFLLESTIAWSESAFIPLFAFTTFALYRLVRDPRVSWGALAGASAGYLYVVHPRGLIPAVAAGLTFVLLGVRRTLPRRIATVTLLVEGAVVTVGMILNRVVASASYRGGSNARFLEPSLELGLDGIRWFLFEAIGQSWYLFASSFGLVLAGVVILLRRAAARAVVDREERARAAAFRFALVATAGVFALSVFFMMTPERGDADHHIYGRYNEGVMALPLALGIAAFVGRDGRALRWPPVAGGAALIACAALLPFSPGADRLNEPVNSVTTLGIIPWVRIFDGLHVAGITALALGALGLVVLARSMGARRGLLALGAVFAGLALAAFALKVLPAGRAGEATRHLPAEIHRLDAESVSYDFGAYRSGGFFGYQFWLGDVPLLLYEDAGPSTSLIISAPSWPLGEGCGARRVFVDERLDQALWEMEEGTRSCLELHRDELTFEGAQNR